MRSFAERATDLRHRSASTKVAKCVWTPTIEQVVCVLLTAKGNGMRRK